MATTAPDPSQLDDAELLRRGITEQLSEITLDDVPVRGEIPSWLTGTLVRLSPSQFHAGEMQLRHWFDGLSMLHRFGVRDGRVDYANRFLRSRQYRTATEEGRLGASEFGTDPCRTLFGRVMTMFRPEFTDNANVNVMRLAGEAVAMTETPMPIRFDPQTLETLGVSDWAERVPGVLTIAHPHADPVTGDLVSFATEIGARCKVNVYRMDPKTKETRVLASIPDSYAPYMHSFAITERHIILVTFPLVIDQRRMAKAMLKGGRGVVDAFREIPGRGTTFHVFDRESGEVRARVEGPPFFTFHHVNAYEREDGAIVLDLFAYDDGGIVEALMLDRLRRGEPIAGAELRRCVLDPAAGTVEITPLAEPNAELGRIDYGRRNGRPYRHLYAVSSKGTGPGNRDALLGDQIIKIDVEDGGRWTAWHEDDCLPGEPVFVPRPGGEEEDDGVVLSVVLDGRSHTSFLLVLDAASFTELARAELPQHVPLGFHGSFFGG